MKLSELKHRLTQSLLVIDKERAYDSLRAFHELGGEQFDAYELLKDLRKTCTFDEDLILELMDIVSGWCGTGCRIWENRLGSRVCLYTVNGIEIKNNTLALLPGIHTNHIHEYDLGWLTQGVELELHYPDGSVMKTAIASYYMNATRNFENQIEIRDARMVICVEEPKCVPLGTRVWSVRQR